MSTQQPHAPFLKMEATAERTYCSFSSAFFLVLLLTFRKLGRILGLIFISFVLRCVVCFVSSFHDDFFVATEVPSTAQRLFRVDTACVLSAVCFFVIFFYFLSNLFI